MKKLLLLSLLSSAIFTARSQNTDCKVLSDSLKGTYEGDCKNGKAEGMGKATGTDSYDGEFKSGLPEGKGKYTWKNGDVYTGSFKKGLKEGYGEFRKRDSLTTGYWKKNVYRSKYEKPYIIQTSTGDIGRVDVNKTGDDILSISISVSSLSSRSNSLNQQNELPVPVASMTSFQLLNGYFISKSRTTLSNSELTVFRDVQFPFRAVFYFGQSSIDIEFLEPGKWEVMIPILK